MITLDFDMDNIFIVKTVNDYSKDILVIGKNTVSGRIMDFSLSVLNKDMKIIGVDDI